MKPVARNILAVVVGLVVGSAVNMGLVMVSGAVIPLPAGVDVSTVETLRENSHLLEPRHFVFPFLAHALGTLVGAIIAARIAATHQLLLAMFIGVSFLIGGTTMVVMARTPVWFNLLDLVAAYLPMGWLGWKLGMPKKQGDFPSS